MSDTPETEVVESELDLLKEQADAMGLKYSPNIGVVALREKVRNALEGEPKKEPEKKAEAQPIGDKEPDFGSMTEDEFIRYHRQEAYRLVRIRIACLNPDKATLQGEIITVGNDVIGTMSKYVPFNLGDVPYHVPNAIYQVLKNRKFLQLVEQKSKVTGQRVPEARWVPEFSIEVLPQLTPEELRELAAQQQATGSIDDEPLTR